MTVTAGHRIPTEGGEYRATVPASPPLLVFFCLRLLMVARRLVLAVILGGVAAVGIALLLPKEYTATASFTADDESMLPAGLSGLVGNFAGLQKQGLSPQLAAALVSRNSSLVPTLYERFPTRSGDGRADSVRLLDRLVRPGLLAHLISPTRDSAHMEFAALRELRSRVAADISERTGLVTVVVTLRDPVLAAAVANRLVDRVDEFNAHTNQTRAGATRVFLEGRTQETGRALRQAESDLAKFHSTNRDFRSSPTLALEESRLQRQVEIHQQVYLSLVEKLESARIDEVKDTPVLTRVERATPPVKKSFPRFSIFGLSGAFLGLLLVLGTSFGLAYVEWYRNEDPEGYDRLADSARQARTSIRRVIRPRPRGRVAEGS
ncbi:MAG TPA: hypothetical protein VFK04_17705 [Gemmatimonadaceae bacterium]|nr:hypothetical protein [Gemmatimonadaceae bacterium]